MNDRTCRAGISIRGQSDEVAKMDEVRKAYLGL